MSYCKLIKNRRNKRGPGVIVKANKILFKKSPARSFYQRIPRNTDFYKAILTNKKYPRFIFELQMNLVGALSVPVFESNIH